MENLEGVSMTELDALVSDNKMQMLKAALPYISATQQQVLSIYVKVLELNNTIQLVHKEESRKVGICSVSEQKRNTTEMLNTIKRWFMTKIQNLLHPPHFKKHLFIKKKTSIPDNTFI